MAGASDLVEDPRLSTGHPVFKAVLLRSLGFMEDHGFQNSKRPMQEEAVLQTGDPATGRVSFGSLKPPFLVKHTLCY